MCSDDNYLSWASAAGGKGGPCPPWIFTHVADKVVRGLMVLFFGLVFSVDPLPGNFYANALATHLRIKPEIHQHQPDSRPILAQLLIFSLLFLPILLKVGFNPNRSIIGLVYV